MNIVKGWIKVDSKTVANTMVCIAGGNVQKRVDGWYYRPISWQYMTPDFYVNLIAQAKSFK